MSRDSHMPNSIRDWSKSGLGCFPAEADVKRCCCEPWIVLRRFVLVGAANRVGNFRPAILVPYALWNIDQLYVQ